MEFLDRPAYLDQRGASRCGLPAEVRYRFTMRSTGGPAESAAIRCPSGHLFNGPIEFLTLRGKITVRMHVTTGHSHDRRDHTDLRELAAGRPGNSRSAGAPAYYLGRPASLWLTALNQYRRTDVRST